MRVSLKSWDPPVSLPGHRAGMQINHSIDWEQE